MNSIHPLEELLSEHPGIQYIDACYPDLSCVFRGKRFPVAQAQKLFQSGMMSPGGTFLLAVNGDCMDPDGMGVSDGDPDEVAKPIEGTLVTCPWAQLPTAQVMLSLESLTGEPYYFEPRNVLSRVIEKFNNLELTPVVAFELEFYLLDCNRDESGGIQVPVGPLTGVRTGTTQVYSMDDVEEFALYIDDVISGCAQQGILTGAISGEYAPGQFEINLQHSDQLLKAADQCMMFRRVVTSTARRHGYQATFMAKPWEEQSGSGLHLHLSLLDKQGRNVFDGGGEYGSPECGSALLYQAIAGLQNAMADSMGIFAPNINSYQRFAPNMYVPVSTDWGFENRSVALRIPKSHGAARRIEHRISGADANPYLVLAALLSGVHDGIEHQRQASPPAQGNAGEELDPNLPFEPEKAFAQCQQSSLLQHYFGKRYIHAYGSCKLREIEEFRERKISQADWYL